MAFKPRVRRWKDIEIQKPEMFDLVQVTNNKEDIHVAWWSGTEWDSRKKITPHYKYWDKPPGRITDFTGTNVTKLIKMYT